MRHAATTHGGGEERGSLPRAWAVAVLSGLLVFALAGLLALNVRESVREDAADLFEESVDQVEISVESQIESYFGELNDMGAFVANAPGVSAESFAGFVSDSTIFDRFPSVVGVFYLQRVEPGDLEEFIEEAAMEDPSFAFMELGEVDPGEPRYILRYYVPGRVDLALPHGTDITTIAAVTNLVRDAEPRRRGVAGSFQQDPFLLEVAEMTDFPMVDALLAVDFFIGLPVTQRTAAGEERVVGWVGAPIEDFGAVATEAGRGVPENIGLRLTVDLDDAGYEGRDDLSRVAERVAETAGLDRAAFARSNTFEVDGVRWELTVWSAADAGAAGEQVGFVLFVGLLVSCLAAGFSFFRIRSRTRARLLTAELADREQFQHDILDSVTSAMVVLDQGGRIRAANSAWAVLRGTRLEEVREDLDLGGSYLDVIGSSLRAGTAELADAVDRVLKGKAGSAEVDVPIEVGANRRWYAVRATPLRGRRGGAVVVHTDVTERKRSHDELELRASHDDLTGVLNRAALEREVEDALRRARAKGGHVGVLFVDLDGFKPVNDTYGHAVGDEVLRAVARRLSSAVRTVDRVARVGGDEFVVLISSLRDVSVAESTASRILQVLSEPIRARQHELRIAASIGVAVIESPLDVSSSDVLHRADEAMYSVKQRGGDGYAVAG